MASSPPTSVEAAAILTVSSSEGKNFTISAGSKVIFSPASFSTSPGNWKIFRIPFQKPPALRLSASMKPETISAMNTTSMMPPYMRLVRVIAM